MAPSVSTLRSHRVANQQAWNVMRRHEKIRSYQVKDNNLKEKGVNNMKTALLIIDVQNDYFPNGKMELNNSINASLKIKDLIIHFRNKSIPIIHIKHISIRPGSTFKTKRS